jgi:hypothetical protein
MLRFCAAGRPTGGAEDVTTPKAGQRQPNFKVWLANKKVRLAKSAILQKVQDNYIVLTLNLDFRFGI